MYGICLMNYLKIHSTAYKRSIKQVTKYHMPHDLFSIFIHGFSLVQHTYIPWYKATFKCSKIPFLIGNLRPISPIGSLIF